jgi:hypothetical protein
MTNTNKSDLVMIEWVDSGQPIPGWQWLADLGPRRAHKCVSVGFLVQQNGGTTVLAPNLASSNGDEDWDQVSGLFTIPTVAIVKIQKLTSASSPSMKTCDPAAA